MKTNPFFTPGSKVQKVLRIADQLALSLRENVELIDFEDNNATFVTESGYVIEGRVDFKRLGLTDISVATGEIFENEEAFDNVIHQRVTTIFGDLLRDDTYAASDRYDSILHLWEARMKYDRVLTRLQEKKANYNLYRSITESEQFEVLQELRPILVEFLSKNKDQLVKVKQILDSLTLSNTISEAFNLPEISVQDLEEMEFRVDSHKFDTIYDIICAQELIKKDLMENKKAFTSMWLNSDEISELLQFVGSKDVDGLLECLAETISNNPYFALATKKQLREVFERSISFNDIDSHTQKDIQDFVSLIYETKKPAKIAVLRELNEKFGINVQNLKITPTFTELGKTQKVIFESLQKLAPRGSALKTGLSEMARILGHHHGVDVIDLNDWLMDIFNEATLLENLNETSLMSYMNFEKVAQDLAKIGDVLKMLQAGLGGGAGEMGGQNPMGADPMGGGMGNPAMGGEEMPEDGQYEPDGMAAMEDEESGIEGVEGAEDDGDISPEEAAVAAQQDVADEVSDDMMDDAEEEGPEQVGEEEFMGYLDELEDLISTLKGEMGFDSFKGDPSELEGEEEEEGEFGDEEDGDVDIDTGDGDDDVHVDVSSHDTEGEGEEEEPVGSDGEDADDDGDMDEPNPKIKKKKKPPFPTK